MALWQPSSVLGAALANMSGAPWGDAQCHAPAFRMVITGAADGQIELCPPELPMRLKPALS